MLPVSKPYTGISLIIEVKHLKKYIVGKGLYPLCSI
jgi:hypothetical protein